MTSEILIAVLSLTGTLIGSLAGILAANKLTTYRIEQLEIKVDKHNSIIERFVVLEESVKTQWKRIDEMRATIEEIRDKVK